MKRKLTLFPYQEEGVTHLMSPLKASYLADAPGLGKTIQSLTATERLKAKTLAVFCPASIVNQWQEHVSTWGKKALVASYDSFAVANVTKQEREKLAGYHTLLDTLKANPQPMDTVWRAKMSAASKKANTIARTIKRKERAKILRAEIRAKGPFDVVICDEAHYLKEREAHRTGYIFHSKHGLAHLGKKIMLLSGTPMLNRPSELYPVLRACFPEAIEDCPTFEAYGYKFCDAGWGYNGATDYTGSSNGDELGKRLEGFMLARTIDVLGDKIPGITYKDHFIDLSESDIQIFEDEHIATRRRLTGEAKVDKLVAGIRRVSRSVKKLVVFYYHDVVRIALQRAFPHSPLIKGGLTSYQKAQQIERFVSLGNEVMLVQLGAGGVGLDGLQYVCNTGYLAELDWTPPLEDQAVGRLWRLGQKEHVTIYRPVATKQGLDERIDEKGKEKRVIISGILQHVTSKIANHIVRGEPIMSLDEHAGDIVLQLSRIADALEAQAGIETATVAPKPAGAKGAAKSTKAPKAVGITIKQAREAIKAELNSDAKLTQPKMAAYKQVQADWGVDGIDGVEADDYQKFVDASLAAMTHAVENKGAGDDDI